jgi:CRISPR-associated protein Cmr6
MSTEHLDCLFGCEPKVSDAPTEADSGDSGYVIFHDAWWMPGSAATPLAKEVITPHHGAYYQSQGETPPRDTDSPTITSQIAVRGAFLFAVEGVGEWKKTAVNLLKAALQSEGLGSRTHLGYGLFVG